jgi:hypothetical protein
MMIYAVIRMCESHVDGPRQRSVHEPATVLLIPWLILPILVIVWAIVLLTGLAAICNKWFLGQ